jgi:hypothetical protein
VEWRSSAGARVGLAGVLGLAMLCEDVDVDGFADAVDVGRPGEVSRCLTRSP